MLTITLATKNDGKRQELEHWLAGMDLPLHFAINRDAPDVDETGDSFLANAWLKAKGTPPTEGSTLVLAEDSGLVVDALDGVYGISPFPGIYSNRWLNAELRNELLSASHPNRMPSDRTYAGVTNSDLCQAILKLMKGKSNRSARYCCGMVLWHTERGRLFETLESTELEIIQGEPRGMNGFGYDPITAPLGEIRTMAELDTDYKNQISHRGKAVRKLLDFLKQENLLPL
jgi:XTP/dITP diphosphohydrolase